MARLASRSGMAQVLASIAMSSSDPSEMLQVRWLSRAPSRISLNECDANLPRLLLR